MIQSSVRTHDSPFEAGCHIMANPPPIHLVKKKKKPLSPFYKIFFQIQMDLNPFRNSSILLFVTQISPVNKCTQPMFIFLCRDVLFFYCQSLIKELRKIFRQPICSRNRMSPNKDPFFGWLPRSDIKVPLTIFFSSSKAQVEEEKKKLNWNHPRNMIFFLEKWSHDSFFCIIMADIEPEMDIASNRVQGG